MLIHLFVMHFACSCKRYNVLFFLSYLIDCDPNKFNGIGIKYSWDKYAFLGGEA